MCRLRAQPQKKSFQFDHDPEERLMAHRHSEQEHMHCMGASQHSVGDHIGIISSLDELSGLGAHLSAYLKFTSLS